MELAVYQQHIACKTNTTQDVRCQGTICSDDQTPTTQGLTSVGQALVTQHQYPNV